MVALRYRGRNISDEDILYIRELIAMHPGASRRTLSTKLCEAWQWRQANGALRDMVCRGLLLMRELSARVREANWSVRYESHIGGAQERASSIGASLSASRCVTCDWIRMVRGSPWPHGVII
jgi:hypothetical protein